MEISAPESEHALDASPESFAAFYDLALARLYGYFFHRCGGSREMAEDLTQEAFMAAVAELRKGKQVMTPIAWIYGIARHKLLDHYRTEERAERNLTLAWAPEAGDGDLAAADEPEAAERVTSALASVAASQRAALVLCYVDGYSVPEAARLLGKSIEAVESLLARGRRSFKRAYLEGPP